MQGTKGAFGDSFPPSGSSAAQAVRPPAGHDGRITLSDGGVVDGTQISFEVDSVPHTPELGPLLTWPIAVRVHSNRPAGGRSSH
uniref:Uncharacterized protein n=1 Tax=uncultured prokaryote TaxID=198431 RepID=A0A0H5Q6M7_9ZZZZ|nr:hypothetical protein [uncultured prokaryote]